MKLGRVQSVMLRPVILSCVLFLMASIALSGQTVTIHVRVLNGRTGKDLSGMNLRLVDYYSDRVGNAHAALNGRKIVDTSADGGSYIARPDARGIQSRVSLCERKSIQADRFVRCLIRGSRSLLAAKAGLNGGGYGTTEVMPIMSLRGAGGASRFSQNLWMRVMPPMRRKAPRMRGVLRAWGAMRNQPKWSMRSEVIRAAVTVKPIKGPAPTLLTRVRPA